MGRFEESGVDENEGELSWVRVLSRLYDPPKAFVLSIINFFLLLNNY